MKTAPSGHGSVSAESCHPATYRAATVRERLAGRRLSQRALFALLSGWPMPAALPCADCHREIAAAFSRTAHRNASSEARIDSILGSFEDGRNVWLSRSGTTSFRMEQRGDSFFQTGRFGGASRTERFDYVIGSGRRGQSYLSLRDALLFQLPMSYHVSTKRWINSPGYPEDGLLFDRVITPQCLECHTTRFRMEWAGANVRYTSDYELGLGCVKCHGNETSHEKLSAPMRWSRDRQVELCARCHSGTSKDIAAKPDVHANQVGLLTASRCFVASVAMTCTTCHDVHRMERDPARLSVRCVSCHEPARCPVARREGEAGQSRCVECHMPVEPSRLIPFQTYRTHRIAVYGNSR